MASSDPLSNITIGLSWPRPTTLPEPALQPKWAGEFRDHADWVSFASKRLTVAFDSNGSELKAICVDRLGRRCANGGDMRRAKDEGTFPVRYFWEMEVAPDSRPQSPAGGDDAQPSEAEVDQHDLLMLRALLCLSGFAGEGIQVSGFEDPADVYSDIAQAMSMDDADDDVLRRHIAIEQKRLFGLAAMRRGG